MFKCLIIDDEPIAVRVIKKHLSVFKEFEITGEFNNAVEAMENLYEPDIDLIFCDIQMPQISGIDFVKSLNKPPKIIFTTAYRNYAVEAFDLNVIDYLLKPISFERFAKAINKFLQSQHNVLENKKTSSTEIKHDDYIFLKADKKHYKINLNNILYFESLGDYVIVHCEEKKITIKDKISHLENILPSDNFIRIHRSFIISVPKIEAVGPGFMEINKKKLPLGRTYKNNLDNLMNKF